MSDIIEEAFEKIKFIPKTSYEDCIDTDRETRCFTQRIVEKLGIGSKSHLG